MSAIKKRGAVYGVIGLMLCVAVYLNWSYFQSPTELTVAAQTANDAVKAADSEVYGQVTAVNAESKNQKKESAKTSKTEAKKQTEDNFAKARLDRQTARDAALSLLKETLSGENCSEEAREQTAAKIDAIAANAMKESKIEGEIRNKGYRDAVVYIAEDSVTASVSGPRGKLNATDVAKIADIIVTETGADLSIVKISDAG